MTWAYVLTAILAIACQVSAIDSHEWTIFPSLPGSTVANQRITKEIREIADATFAYCQSNDVDSYCAPPDLFISGNPDISVAYWFIKLTDFDSEKIRGIDGVKAVVRPRHPMNPDAGESPSKRLRRTSERRNRRSPSSMLDEKRATFVERDPDRPIASLSPAPTWLQQISQAKGQPINSNTPYYYDKIAGKGIRIYMIDTGLRKSHKEFSHMEKETETPAWIYGGPKTERTEDDSEKPDPKDPNLAVGHGTCMAGGAIGDKTGVARLASLTVVKAPNDDAYWGHNWIDALWQIIQDIKERGIQHEAVVSISLGFNGYVNDQFTTEISETMARLLRQLTDELDVPVVIAAGNFPEWTDPDESKWVLYPDAVPGILKKPEVTRDLRSKRGAEIVPDLSDAVRFKVDKLLIVTATDHENNEQEPFVQRADWTEVAGIGDIGRCADNRGDDVYHNGDSGTSSVTARVAGLIAYFMSVEKDKRIGLVPYGQTPGLDAKQKVIDLAYPRTKGGPKVIWNEIDTRNFARMAIPKAFCAILKVC